MHKGNALFLEVSDEGEDFHPIFCFDGVVKVLGISIFPQVFEVASVKVKLFWGILGLLPDAFIVPKLLNFIIFKCNQYFFFLVSHFPFILI